MWCVYRSIHRASWLEYWHVNAEEICKRYRYAIECHSGRVNPFFYLCSLIYRLKSSGRLNLKRERLLMDTIRIENSMKGCKGAKNKKSCLSGADSLMVFAGYNNYWNLRDLSRPYKDPKSLWWWELRIGIHVYAQTLVGRVWSQSSWMLRGEVYSYSQSRLKHIADDLINSLSWLAYVGTNAVNMRYTYGRYISHGSMLFLDVSGSQKAY